MLTEAQNQAFEQLMSAHYVPAFVKSCADRGLEVTDSNLQQTLETAAKLKLKMAEVAEKNASENGAQELLNAAEHNLNTLLYGEEKAAEMLKGSAAPSVSAVPEATQKALATLATKPAEEAAK